MACEKTRDQLSPCKRCGGKARPVWVHGYYTVICDVCSAQVNYQETRQQAINLWEIKNMRVGT